MNPEVIRHINEILRQKDLWSYVFTYKDSLHPTAVSVVHALTCGAGEIKEYLPSVPDEYLDLLDNPKFRSSAVKSKALDVRLRRRARS